VSVKVGDVVEVVLSGKKAAIRVEEVVTCPAGADLPQGYIDVTGNRDIDVPAERFGIKGTAVGD